MRRRYSFRSTSRTSDEDPLSGMANLFDISMVFAVALMVALVVHFQMTEMLTQNEITMVKNPGKENMEIIVKKGKEITRYRGTRSSGAGKGRRVGVAYELESGEIIYVPE
ncbi:MAG: DUF2149 domain-containing protein [Candidatus Omnitrophota bacterium]|nr:DUF2149 domain-containing protein [Candidatus Omnitrophota bacterium]